MNHPAGATALGPPGEVEATKQREGVRPPAPPSAPGWGAPAPYPGHHHGGQYHAGHYQGGYYHGGQYPYGRPKSAWEVLFST